MQKNVCKMRLEYEGGVGYGHRPLFLIVGQIICVELNHFLRV